MSFITLHQNYRYRGPLRIKPEAIEHYWEMFDMDTNVRMFCFLVTHSGMNYEVKETEAEIGELIRQGSNNALS